MKILFCHNYYQQAGGEDVALANEMALLKKHGHDVQLYSASNNQIKGFWKKLLVSLNLIYSNHHKAELTKHIRRFSPDVVHIHNFFPLLTPSLFDACIEEGVPVVHTLHNYRLLCPSATLYINGKSNTESITKSAYAMVKYKAYKNSYLGTYLLARAIEFYKKSKLWHNKVDCFIAPSLCLKNIYISAGFPEEIITVKPNFIESEPKTGNNAYSTIQTNIPMYAMFVGRLTQEKGIEFLLSSWRETDVELRIYGSGPLASFCQKATRHNVSYMGEVDKKTILSALSNAQYLVMPTQWQEPFGFVAIEALSQGTPVIASKLGAMTEIIQHERNGLLFTPLDNNNLQNQIDVMKNKEKRDMMAKQARALFEKSYSAQVNYSQTLSIYQSVIARKYKLVN